MLIDFNLQMAGNGSYSSSWTSEENKAFENPIATYNIGDSEKIPEQVQDGHSVLVPNNESKGREPGQQGCRGIPWTEAEHTLFLEGLQKYGKGDWQNISRDYVISRTAAQCASHAQKYFRRMKSQSREGRRRPSVLDKTTLDNSQVPITGEPNQVASQMPPSVQVVSKPTVGPSTGPLNPHVDSGSSSRTQGRMVEDVLKNDPMATYDFILDSDEEFCFDDDFCLNDIL